MGHRCLAVLTVIAVVLLAPVPVAGQAQTAGADTPRTLDGRPDLSGVWDFRTLTPLERPAELADKEFLTDEAAAAFEAQTLEWCRATPAG